MTSEFVKKNIVSISLTFLTIILFIFAKPIYGTTDDFILNSWLNKTYSGLNEQESIFITTVFSHLMSFTYQNIGAIAWYPLTLLAVTFFSILTLLNHVLQSDNISKKVKHFNVLILTSYYIWSFLGITYTSTAIIAGVASLFTLKEWMRSESQKDFTVALLFAFASVVIRPEGFIGAILLIYPIILFKIKISRVKIFKLSLFAIFLFSVLFTSKLIESNSPIEMKEYREWAKKVQMFAGRPRMQAAAQVIGDTGWTTTQYNLFVDLAYFDHKKFNNNWISQGIEATNPIVTSPKINADKIFDILVEYFNTLSIYSYILIFSIILSFVSIKGRKNLIFLIAILGNFGLILLINGLFLHNVSRVTIPFAITLIFLISYFFNKNFSNKILSFINIGLILVFLNYFIEINNLNTKKELEAVKSRNAIVKDLQDKVVLVHGNQEYFQNFNPYLNLEKDSDPNVFMVGNWDTFSPQWYRRAKLVGLNQNNIIESLLLDPKVYWSGPSIPNTTLNLINYLKESGYGEFNPVKVGSLPNGNDLWKFAKSGGPGES